MQFNGLWIPGEILNNKELSLQEKFILSVILSLSKEKGYCFASNEYIAKMMNISSDRVSKILSNLNKKKLIRIQLNYKVESKKVERRKIMLNIKSEGSEKQPGNIGENDYINSYKGQAYIGKNNEDIINNYNNINKNCNKQQSKIKYFQNIRNERQYDFDSWDFLYANPQRLD